MKRLKELRANKSQTYIANKIGLNQRAYSNYENGTREADYETLKKIADYFHVSVDYLLGRTDVKDIDIFNYPNILQIPETELIPLLGNIACGLPTLAEENIEEYIKADKSLKATFALKCKGDSMINARIFDGDIVYIRQQDDVENGEIAAVLIDNEATLKRVYKYPTYIDLRAENPTFPTLHYEKEELNSIHILGKAVAFLSAIR
ncbi:MAG: S24 family peptidase [Clostridia bacterium]